MSRPFPTESTIRGDSGRTYTIQEILTQRQDHTLNVYRASAEDKSFIIKDMIPGEFEYQLELQKPLFCHPNLRTVVDTILSGDLLRMSKRIASKATKTSVLRSDLAGLAELQDKNIIHTDIKPNDILLNYSETEGSDPIIQSVQISDLEDAVALPPGKNLKGCLCGNQLWRSPESWARAKQNISSDVFSFGIVAIYVILDDIIFLVSDEELKGNDAWWHILRRHISFLGDEDGFVGLLDYIGQENPFFERLIALAGDFNVEKPRKPFAFWRYVDEGFRDLIAVMTNLNPAKRITARQAMEHLCLKCE
ncbi:kinase-like protein [Aaosphaeria arxii CBS 175.79]|uniref:non-specific serine/threonine protein kinase n=1 Tax=Aaosphaeria arxii CBS 175.79 TaxID=1450172 RepID=A0A6A5XC78_9PLEO|nr:kinase-like protein [Aaosphaeria arxii CBS 175.79]KAF2010426.1 kinase-like protein [Aaosphaeria arxii CBS 175.79]